MLSPKTTLHITKKIVLPIYWAILTFVLLKPSEAVPKYWFLFTGIDKVVHIGIFAMLAFLYRLSFRDMPALLFFSVMLGYGVATEILQGLMHAGRSMEFLDLIADMFGVGIGYITANLLLKTTFFNNAIKD